MGAATATLSLVDRKLHHDFLNHPVKHFLQRLFRHHPQERIQISIANDLNA